MGCKTHSLALCHHKSDCCTLNGAEETVGIKEEEVLVNISKYNLTNKTVLDGIGVT
jgi:hypothetical protein